MEWEEDKCMIHASGRARVSCSRSPRATHCGTGAKSNSQALSFARSPISHSLIVPSAPTIHLHRFPIELPRSLSHIMLDQLRATSPKGPSRP